MVYWWLLKIINHYWVDTTWFIEGIMVHGWVSPLTNQFFEMPSLASHRCRMLTSTWSATVMRCSKETWKSMRRWFPIGQARLTRRAQPGEWDNSGMKLDGIDVSWPRKLIEVSDFSIEPPILIHFGGQSCWIMLRARFRFYSDICWVHIELVGRCWCWILMGILGVCTPNLSPKVMMLVLNQDWRILRSLRHQQRWIGGSSAPISHWVSRTNKKLRPPMPSRAAGAVKDDVKFDLNKLSKGPPDQPGMLWETKEGEVSIVYSRLVHLSFCHFDGNYTVYFNIIYIYCILYTHTYTI